MARIFWGLTTAFPGIMALVSFLAVIFGSGTAKSTIYSFGSTSTLDPASSSCNFVTLSDMRSAWSSNEEPCGQKLPFELCIYMKAEGTAEDPDANHVRIECLKPRDVDLIELTTPKAWNSTTLNAAPGELLRETKRSASYLGRSPLDFEVMCSDEQVANVSRVDLFVETSAFPRRKSKRRLKSTASGSGTAHEELPTDFVDEIGIKPKDEGLAMTSMTELEYNIAGGANFKFNIMSESSMVVTYDDMIEMLTDCRYPIDVTSDAGGEIEIWGAEAGYGITSANQMLDWIATNCQGSCSAPPISPTEAPPTVFPMSSPTQMPPAPPTLQPTSPPVSPPIVPPTSPPTSPPVVPPTYPPTSPPIAQSSSPPIASPMAPPTIPPLVLPISFSTTPPSEPPVVPPTTTSTSQPVLPQASPSTASPTLLPNPTPTSPVGSPIGGGTLVDAGERTTVAVIANAIDTRTSGFGCARDGDTAANTRDGDLSTRSSCKKDLLDDNCEIVYTFEEPQDIVRVLIVFYTGEDIAHKLKIKLNGSSRSVILSSGETNGFEDFELTADETETLTSEGLGLRGDEWISITEVQFMVQ